MFSAINKEGGTLESFKKQIMFQYVGWLALRLFLRKLKMKKQYSRVLVCHDSPDFLEQCLKDFRDFGVEPKWVARPVEALREAQTSPYDAFFIDLQNDFGHNIFDANDLAARIRELQPSKPMIAISAIGEEINQRRLGTDLSNFDEVLSTYYSQESSPIAFHRELGVVLKKYGLS